MVEMRSYERAARRLREACTQGVIPPLRETLVT